MRTRRDKNSIEFCRWVEVKNGSSEPNSKKMFARRKFEVGDAITFLCKDEEHCGFPVLGGFHARIVSMLAESNTYLTSNGTLRCSKPILKGEEITRFDGNSERDEILESVDMIVVRFDTMKVGRVGCVNRSHPGILVCYPNGSKELECNNHLQCFSSTRLFPSAVLGKTGICVGLQLQQLGYKTVT
ncbi:unnamed protein product [Cylindrotheca closterium]|uniref:Uncharacterized protein n=1 Tax=Cylindrotheca closterium TaxID=2856 RepID=A0AAD2CII9_9STRA|nr:unnamed protein product [Cylindrotheca closterium]